MDNHKQRIEFMFHGYHFIWTFTYIRHHENGSKEKRKKRKSGNIDKFSNHYSDYSTGIISFLSF